MEDIPRKVQVTGKNTFILSLPHEWIESRGVKKGDPIYIMDGGEGSLILSLKGSSKELKTCVISVSDSKETMRNIVSAYVGGAGKIILRGNGTNTVAEEARRVLSGVEISEENSDELILRVLAFDDMHLDSIMKRQSTVTQSMFELAVAVFRDKADAFTELSRKEDDVDRLYLLLLRNLCIGRYASSDSAFKVIAAKSIEKISDHLEDVCLQGKAMAPNPMIAELLEKAGKAYCAAYKAFSMNELDMGGFTLARKEFILLYDKSEASLRKEKDVTRMLALRSMMEKCNKLMRYSEDIMESSGDIVFARMK
jgi:phosphate uptake regulator